jgi:Flp pilus assembly protein TadG
MKKLNNHRGQSTIEISLIAPLLMMALYIPTDFGITLFTAHLTQNAVREAARIGVSSKDPFDNAAADSVGDEVLSRLPALLGSATATVRYYAGGLNCSQYVEVSGGELTIFSVSVDAPGWLYGSGYIQIDRSTTMRYEFQPLTNDTPCTGVTLTRTRPVKHARDRGGFMNPSKMSEVAFWFS